MIYLTIYPLKFKSNLKLRTNYTQTYTTTQQTIMSQNNSVEILLEPVFLKKGVNGYDSTGVLRYKSNGLYFHGVRPDEKEAKKGCGSFWGYGWDIENHKPAPGSSLRKLHKKKWDFHIELITYPLPCLGEKDSVWQ